MERISTNDQVMLWPDKLWPQDVGALGILDGQGLFAPDGSFRIEAVRETIAARLPRVPRLRQRLLVPPRGLGRPLWVDAHSFDLAEHVQVRPVEAPGDESRLLQAVEQLRRRRLDRARPLWEMWFLPGLDGGRVGWFVKIHHVLADGLAAMATIGTFLDETPDPADRADRSGQPARARTDRVGSATAGDDRGRDGTDPHAPPGPPVPWVPAPAPTSLDLLKDNLREHAAGLRRGVTTLAHPAPALRKLRDVWPTIRSLATAKPPPATSLNRLAGPGRTTALVRSELGLVKGIARAHGATVNDVLLAVTAGGLWTLLSARGEAPADLALPVYLPIALRRPGKTQGNENALNATQGKIAQNATQGNEIAQIAVPLPLAEPDPGERLRRIAAETAGRKARGVPPVGMLLGNPIARWAMLEALSRYPVNVTTADLVGPPRPVTLAGARLLEVFPVLPLIGNVSLGVGALSYAGQFTIGVTGDRDTYPDLDLFVAGMERELNTLAAACAVGR